MTDFNWRAAIRGRNNKIDELTAAMEKAEALAATQYHAEQEWRKLYEQTKARAEKAEATLRATRDKLASAGWLRQIDVPRNEIVDRLFQLRDEIDAALEGDE